MTPCVRRLIPHALCGRPDRPWSIRRPCPDLGLLAQRVGSPGPPAPPRGRCRGPGAPSPFRTVRTPPAPPPAAAPCLRTSGSLGPPRAPGRGRVESERQRAESQWIVAARPLCHLQYPVAYLSRLQRIHPAARWESNFKAVLAALPPLGLGQRLVPLGARGPYCGSAIGRRDSCVASSPDSDLEAFSHNPAHGSFAPLAFQPSAMTNCANQRFLSY